MTEIEIIDYDVPDDSSTPDSPPGMQITGGTVATVGGTMSAGHIHEANSRVWVQDNDPVYLADGVTANPELRPGDIWIVMDYQDYLAGLVTADPGVHLYHGRGWAQLSAPGAPDP